MVSQSQNDEWPSPPSRTGSTLSVDFRQPPGGGVKTPPSYFDAVRSRHSLSQPENFKLEKPLDLQQVKYNSLPRPLPQRLQVCTTNELDNHYKPPVIRQPLQPEKMSNSMFTSLESNGGFQIYAKPPGPANHVPLHPRTAQFPGVSNSSSLPRCFPRNKMAVYNNPSSPRDMQQPLSVIVRQNEYDMNQCLTNFPQGNPHDIPPQRRMQQPQQFHQLPGYKPNPMPPDAVNGRYPVYQNHADLNDPRKAPPRSQNHQPPMHQQQQQRGLHYRQQYALDGNSRPFAHPRYSREGTLQSPPQRNTLPEPAVSRRTGPLGSYPESRPVHPNSLPPESLQQVPGSSPDKHQVPSAFGGHQKHPDPHQNRLMTPPQVAQRGAPPHRGAQDPYGNIHHQDWYNPHLPQPTEMPSRRQSNPENISSYVYQNSMSQSQSNDMSLQNQRLMHPANGHQYELHEPQKFEDRSPNGNFYLPGNFPNSGHKTPEEAGLVMIVESRDLSNQVNSIAKDVVKPTPRIPVTSNVSNLSRNGNLVNGSRMNHDNYPRPPDCYMDSQRFPPGPSYVKEFSGDAFTRVVPNGNPEPTQPSSSGKIISSRNSRTVNGGKVYENGDMYQAVPSSHSNQFNTHLMRNTPLSSSTASLNSEISSVSSPHRRSQIDVTQRRFQGSKAVVNEINGMFEGAQEKKKKEISPSPWTREEREEMQKKQILSARRARDEEIENLESLTERSNKQEELLRILRLEREFQRRAEEIGDDDEEEEEDEALMERADHRERMLLMEKEKAKSAFRKTEAARDSNITSSSDQWLANSQAKHLKQQTMCNGSANNSFEVDQFNDLLKTMNVSPISKDNIMEDMDHQIPFGDLDCNGYPLVEPSDSSNSPSKGRKSDKHHYQAKPLPRAGKTLSPVPEKAALYGNLDFCFPLDSPSQQFTIHEATPVIPTENEYANITYNSNGPANDYVNTNGVAAKRNEFLKSSPNPLDDVFMSKADETYPSKVALRVPLSVAAKDSQGNHQQQQQLLNGRKHTTRGKVSEFVRSLSQDGVSNSAAINEVKKTLNGDLRNGCLRKTVTSPSRRNRPVSDSSLSSILLSLKSFSGHQKGSDDNLDGKSSEYKKIWNSRPEKLTFLDKIRKFSLQAGDDLPKDKVKNSRAQRELEMKFEADPTKVVEQSN